MRFALLLKIGFATSQVSQANVTSVMSQAAQCVSLIIKTCGFILRILKWPVNIKDLYGNSGKRFKWINTR